jgi:hypothetical protein
MGTSIFSRRRMRRAAVGVVATFAASLAAAQTSSDPELAEIERRLDEASRKLEALKRELAEEERKLAEDRRAFQRRSNEKLNAISGRGALPGSAVTPMIGLGLGRNNVETAQAAPQGAPQQQTPQQQAPQQQPSAPQPPSQAPQQQAQPAQAAPQQGPVGEAPPPQDRAPQTAQIFSEPTALTPKGKFVLEPSVQYVYANDNRVALVGFTVVPAITIGLIDVRRVSRDIATVALTGRYGIFNRGELEVRVPYVFANSTTITRPLATPSVTDETFDSSGSGIGDVEVTGRYQFNRFTGENAVYIGYLRYKSNTGVGPYEIALNSVGLPTKLATGTGFNAVQPGFTFIYPSDPAVFFGGAAYTYSFSRDVGNGFGDVTPGGIVDLNLGMGLALNEKASFSVGYQHSIVGTASQSGNKPELTLAQAGTLQLGTMRFGIAYRLTPKLNMNLSLGIGATNNTPGFEATLRLPYTF